MKMNKDAAADAWLALTTAHLLGVDLVPRLFAALVVNEVASKHDCDRY